MFVGPPFKKMFNPFGQSKKWSTHSATHKKVNLFGQPIKRPTHSVNPRVIFLLIMKAKVNFFIIQEIKKISISRKGKLSWKGILEGKFSSRILPLVDQNPRGSNFVLEEGIKVCKSI
jgi:hypothetical protein